MGKVVKTGLDNLLENYIAKQIPIWLEQGRAEGRIEMTKNLLQEGVPPDIVARNAKMPISWVEQFVVQDQPKGGT